MYGNLKFVFFLNVQKYGPRWEKLGWNSVLNFRRVTHFWLCLLETQVWCLWQCSSSIGIADREWWRLCILSLAFAALIGFANIVYLYFLHSGLADSPQSSHWLENWEGSIFGVYVFFFYCQAGATSDVTLWTFWGNAECFFGTFWWLFDEFLRTLWQLSVDFMRNFLVHSWDFLRTFWRLLEDFKGDFLVIFSFFFCYSLVVYNIF